MERIFFMEKPGDFERSSVFETKMLLGSSDDGGLSGKEATKRLREYGRNELEEKRPPSVAERMLSQLMDPLIYVLLAAGGISVFLGERGDAVIISAVVLLKATGGEIQEGKAQKALESLKKLTTRKALVRRDGKLLEMDAAELVPGDRVLLNAGQQVPADLRLIRSENMKVQEASLTGESVPEEKDAQYVASTGTPLGDRKNMAYMSTFVTAGRGEGIVTDTGMQTEIGRIAKMIHETPEEITPLQKRLGELGTFLSILAVGLCTILFLAAVWQKRDVGEMFLTAISLAVAAVPEGLPLMISLVLMQNTSKMLDHNVLVRKAEGIETAGSLNILFSDKTGTITKGMLEVVDFFTGDGNSIDIAQLSKHSKVKGLVDLAIGKNTQSMFDASHKVIGGNATDQALMKFLGEETFKTLENSSEYKITKQQSFNSANKFSQARIDSTGKTFYKGAPEKLLANAVKYLDADGNICTMDNAILNRKIDELAAKAMRVLAFGYSEKDMVENSINDDIVIIGLVGIRDDVRPEAKEAIREVQGAGIQVVMITGDRLETAVAIAKDAGLLKGGSDRALSSAQLNEMSDEEVKKIIPHIRVIARALPTDKSRMVRLCQEMNLVVGMTGDGVNDSPALKRADVGFAMGSGTEAAKEAGKIVILDDNFKSIKDAILYGRTIYHNILKFCKFQLVINVAAVVVSAIAPFFGVDEPLKVTHLLFVNLVMDGLGAMMLGNEPAKEEYMAEAPRKRDESIVSKKMMGQILTMGIWLTVVSFIYLKVPFFVNLFANEEQHLTGYFVLFIVAALFNGFNVRDDGFAIFAGLNENKDFMKVFLIIIIVQALLVNAAIVPLAPFQWIGEMFSCVPFGIKGWIAVVLLACTMIPADMVRKLCVNK